MSIEKFTGSYVNNTQGFTVLINQTIQNIKEFDVLGLYVYLCSKPSTWKPNAKELMRHTSYSKDKIYRLLNRLLSLGLMSSKQVRHGGKFSYQEYTIHLSPCPEKPDTEKPDTENQETYKIKNIENKDLKYINKHARDSEKNKDTNIVPSKPSTQSNSIDASYEYPETYYSCETKQNSPTDSKEISLSRFSNEIDLAEPPGFKKFWSLYPRKQNKHRSLMQWMHDGCEPYAEAIIEKLNAQVQRDQSFKDGCVPNPWKYIVEKRYLDEVFEGSKSKRTAAENLKSTDWANPFA